MNKRDAKTTSAASKISGAIRKSDSKKNTHAESQRRTWRTTTAYLCAEISVGIVVKSFCEMIDNKISNEQILFTRTYPLPEALEMSYDRLVIVAGKEGMLHLVDTNIALEITNGEICNGELTRMRENVSITFVIRNGKRVKVGHTSFRPKSTNENTLEALMGMWAQCPESNTFEKYVRDDKNSKMPIPEMPPKAVNNELVASIDEASELNIVLEQLEIVNEETELVKQIMPKCDLLNLVLAVRTTLDSVNYIDVPMDDDDQDFEENIKELKKVMNVSVFPEVLSEGLNQIMLNTTKLIHVPHERGVFTITGRKKIVFDLGNGVYLGASNPNE